MRQSVYMQTYDRTSEAGVRDHGREGRPLDEGFDERALDDVFRHGAAFVPGALPEPMRADLLGEAEASRGRFLDLPDRVNGVAQRGEQLAVRIGDPFHPALRRLVAMLCTALAAQPHFTGVHGFMPTEARYMRYTGNAAGLGAHRDGKCYSLLVCVFSIAGSAPFTVFGDGQEPARELLVHAGDLVLLRAPGFAGLRDGRPRHAVGAPLAGERVSLTLRTVRGRPPVHAAREWSRSS